MILTHNISRNTSIRTKEKMINYKRLLKKIRQEKKMKQKERKMDMIIGI